MNGINGFEEKASGHTTWNGVGEIYSGDDSAGDSYCLIRPGHQRPGAHAGGPYHVCAVCGAIPRIRCMPAIGGFRPFADNLDVMRKPDFICCQPELAGPLMQSVWCVRRHLCSGNVAKELAGWYACADDRVSDELRAEGPSRCDIGMRNCRQDIAGRLLL